MKSISEEIRELRGVTIAELKERYQQLFGKAARCRNREHLWKRCSWKLQEQRFGGLSGLAKQKLEQLISELNLPFGDTQRTVSGTLRKSRRPTDPPVGTTLLREWRGEQVRVEVTENGYVWDGIPYRSLSAAARAITGSHLSGPRFFGLARRKKAR